MKNLIHPEDHPLPGQLHTGPLLIIGGGRCVWDDLDRFGDEKFEGARMCVNDVGMHYDRRVDHWTTLHPEWMAGWMSYRMSHVASGKPKPTVHSDKVHGAVDVTWKLQTSGGTSGLLAAFVGLLVGYAPIFLAGVPMDQSGHYFDPPWRSSTGDLDRTATRSVWEWAAAEVFDERVFSMSGWTKRLLGSPIAGDA